MLERRIRDLLNEGVFDGGSRQEIDSVFVKQDPDSLRSSPAMAMLTEERLCLQALRETTDSVTRVALSGMGGRAQTQL